MESGREEREGLSESGNGTGSLMVGLVQVRRVLVGTGSAGKGEKLTDLPEESFSVERIQKRSKFLHLSSLLTPASHLYRDGRRFRTQLQHCDFNLGSFLYSTTSSKGRKVDRSSERKEVQQTTLTRSETTPGESTWRCKEGEWSGR